MKRTFINNIFAGAVLALASGTVCAQTTENDFSELNDFVSVDTLKYPQVANSGFEMWDSEEINEPVSWNSFMTADGVFSDFVKIQQLTSSSDVRPETEGTKSAVLWCRNVLGSIVAQGNLTTGRIAAGDFTAASAKNHNYVDINDPNFCQPLGQLPDSIAVWVKYVPKKVIDSAPYARVSATVHDAYNYIEYSLPEFETEENKAHAVCHAEKNFEGVKDENGNYIWQRLVMPFDTTGYKATDPAYIMVNFATNSYPGKGTAGDSLYVDDVELIYNPRLVAAYPSKMEYNAGDSIKVRFRLEAGYPDLVSGNPVNLVLTDAESNSTVLKSSEEDSDGWLGAVIPEDAQTGDYTVTVVEPISGIAADSVYSIKVNANVVDGIDNPMAGEDVAGSYTVYTISGVKVAYGFGSVDFEALPKGIYMVKRNNAVTKVVNR